MAVIAVVAIVAVAAFIAALVGSAVEPMKCGEEPAPEIERVDDETD